VKYISTRGGGGAVDFAAAALGGLAADGGLLVPARWPALGDEEWRGFGGLSYAELAAHIIGRFSGASVPPATLNSITRRAAAAFDRPEVAPLREVGEGLYLLELFHGPTFAFKDVALQFLGPLLEFFLARDSRRCTAIGATSGDTGSAAICALRGLPSVELFMLHPAGRVSEVQRRQMTTVRDANIHNVAVTGTFDDCQAIVKQLFADRGLREGKNLTTVNSINWARIAAQAVYYVYAALQLGAGARGVSFAVPSGNFGNAFAGYAARRMGLNIARIIIGSNRNDILTRFFHRGEMRARPAVATLSPSMDIQISSNFERLLFELLGRDAGALAAAMAGFHAHGRIKVTAAQLADARRLFTAARADDGQTRREIARTFRDTGEIVDPHTAVALSAARAAGHPCRDCRLGRGRDRHGRRLGIRRGGLADLGGRLGCHGRAPAWLDDHGPGHPWVYRARVLVLAGLVERVGERVPRGHERAVKAARPVRVPRSGHGVDGRVGVEPAHRVALRDAHGVGALARGLWAARARVRDNVHPVWHAGQAVDQDRDLGARGIGRRGARDYAVDARGRLAANGDHGDKLPARSGRHGVDRLCARRAGHGDLDVAPAALGEAPANLHVLLAMPALLDLAGLHGDLAKGQVARRGRCAMGGRVCGNRIKGWW